MSRRYLSILGGILLVTALHRPAFAQSIGIFMDPEASNCSADVGSNPIIELHVMALPGGNVPELSVAQFSVWGLPESWNPDNVFWVDDPALGVSYGNPLFNSATDPREPGMVVAFANDYCRGDGAPPGDVGPIPLGRIVIVGAPTPPNTTIRIDYFALTVMDPRCPFMIGCDNPAAPKICVDGGEAVLNPTAAPGCQSTAVEEHTWAEVKAMYN